VTYSIFLTVCRYVDNLRRFSHLANFRIFNAMIEDVSASSTLDNKAVNSSAGRSKKVAGTAIRTLCLAGLFNGQEHFRVRIPQVHAGHRAGQWHILRTHLVPVLGICGNQVLVHRTGSFCHTVTCCSCSWPRDYTTLDGATGRQPHGLMNFAQISRTSARWSTNSPAPTRDPLPSSARPCRRWR
jgi:hypothetical protein